MKQYDFTNKAILCDNWEQMEHLAELAKMQGIKEYMFTPECIGYTTLIFRVYNYVGNGVLEFTSAYAKDASEVLINYSDFITPPAEVYKRLSEHAVRFENSDVHVMD